MKPFRPLKITTYNKWRKRYKCKRNKGDHTFVFTHARRPIFMPERIFEEYECTACGKGKLRVVK